LLVVRTKRNDPASAKPYRVDMSNESKVRLDGNIQSTRLAAKTIRESILYYSIITQNALIPKRWHVAWAEMSEHMEIYVGE